MLGPVGDSAQLAIVAKGRCRCSPHTSNLNEFPDCAAQRGHGPPPHHAQVRAAESRAAHLHRRLTESPGETCNAGIGDPAIPSDVAGECGRRRAPHRRSARLLISDRRLPTDPYESVCALRNPYPKASTRGHVAVKAAAPRYRGVIVASPAKILLSAGRGLAGFSEAPAT